MINYLNLWDTDPRIKKGLSLIWDEMGEDLRAKALSVCLIPATHANSRLEDIVNEYRAKSYPKVVRLLSFLSDIASSLPVEEIGQEESREQSSD